jgi:hypothetical protein
MIEYLNNCNAPEAEISSTSLTVKQNSVIVIKVPYLEYNVEDLNALQSYYKKVFPNNTVAVMWDNIQIEVVHDQSWKQSRPCANEENLYGY